MSVENGRRHLAILVLALTLAAAGGCGTPGQGSPSLVSPSATATSTSTTAIHRTPLPATPVPLSAAQAAVPCLAQSTGGPFLASDVSHIVCDGHPIELTGFTFYPALLGGAKAWHDPDFPAYIDHVLDMGVAAGQNLIRATDQWDSHASGQVADDPIVWSNMDYLIKAARQRGVFVVVDLSAFRWLLLSQGADPSRPEVWTSFIRFVADRYRDDDAVAFYSIAGEPTPPRNAAQMSALVDFYRSTSDTLRQADPNHLITVGGFNHMEDEAPGLDWWQQIDALPANDIVAVKTYSKNDLALMPAIADYAASVARPVVDEEFGMPQGFGDATFAGGAAYNGLTTGRAPFFESVYSTGRKLGFAGFVFWNMGCQTGRTSYEVSPRTPSVWNVIVRNGAVEPPAGATASSALCS